MKILEGRKLYLKKIILQNDFYVYGALVVRAVLLFDNIYQNIVILICPI